MKLELRHIAPYLPYGLKMYCEDLLEDGNPELAITKVGSISSDFDNHDLDEWWDIDGIIIS